MPPFVHLGFARKPYDFAGILKGFKSLGAFAKRECSNT